jgi:hypothetical protein
VVANKKSSVIVRTLIYGIRIMVAIPALFFLSASDIIPNSRMRGRRNVQKTQREQPSNRNLRPGIHLQPPKQRHRQQTQHPIRRKTHHRMRNTHIRHHSGIDTRTLHTLILSPEKAHRGALEEYQEEVEGGIGDYEEEGGVDGVFVDWLDADSEQEDGDGEANEDCCDGVEELAEPPEVECFGDVGRGDVG